MKKISQLNYPLTQSKKKETDTTPQKKKKIKIKKENIERNIPVKEKKIKNTETDLEIKNTVREEIEVKIVLKGVVERENRTNIKIY